MIITEWLWNFLETRYQNGPTSGIIWHMSHLIDYFLAWEISEYIILFIIEDPVERVQKSALSIILGLKYRSYESALNKLNLETLSARRIRLCEKFAIKAQKHPKFTKWFKPNNKKSITRSKEPKFCEVYYRTERFRKSPISYLTRILNSQWKPSNPSQFQNTLHQRIIVMQEVRSKHHSSVICITYC